MVRAGEMPKPELQDNDVLIQVYAASVNMISMLKTLGAFCRGRNRRR